MGATASIMPRKLHCMGLQQNLTAQEYKRTRTSKAFDVIKHFALAAAKGTCSLYLCLYDTRPPPPTQMPASTLASLLAPRSLRSLSS
eukprot:scaffold2641_cov110-Skeletonema_dohrnii-CCMP3373.AAC.6